VLLTTHYMDEAERCHRLAFIFRGSVLDIGTPEEIVARRGLRAAELQIEDVARATEAAELLRVEPDVEEVEHYGPVLRVATRGGADPADVARRVLRPADIALASLREARITVEDAFVSMVRAEDRVREKAGAQ
jgi:ABC-2 type transport system ATP-binding protein